MKHFTLIISLFLYPQIEQIQTNINIALFLAHPDFDLGDHLNEIIHIQAISLCNLIRVVPAPALLMHLSHFRTGKLFNFKSIATIANNLT